MEAEQDTRRRTEQGDPLDEHQSSTHGEQEREEPYAPPRQPVLEQDDPQRDENE